MKVALYARVSTADQNPQLQLREMRAYCKRRKFTIVEEFVDQVTGDVEGRARRRNRPDVAYRALMDQAKRGKFKAVIVWRYDRFARSLVSLIDALQFFNTHGIDFVSITEQIDTTTREGRLLFTFIASFAQYEREVIRDRVVAGLKNAKARGQRLGRPRDLTTDAKILKLAAEGLSVAEIARRTKRSRAGVRLTLGRKE